MNSLEFCLKFNSELKAVEPKAIGFELTGKAKLEGH